MNNYESRMSSPAWRKKSKRLREERGECEICGDDKVLHAHHRYYVAPHKEIDQSIAVLCKDCHDLWHQNHYHNVLTEELSEEIRTLLSLGETKDNAFSMVESGTKLPKSHKKIMYSRSVKKHNKQKTKTVVTWSWSKYFDTGGDGKVVRKTRN